MDNEGHLVSIISHNFLLSNESIEHLSNFPHVRYLKCSTMKTVNEESNYITNFSKLSNLRKLSVRFEKELEDPELFQDLGLFTNLLCLYFHTNLQDGFLRFLSIEFV